MLDIDMDRVQAMRAEGKTYRQIADSFGCSVPTIRRRRNPESERAAARSRYAANPELWRERNRRNRAADPDATRAYNRSRYAANSAVFKERMRRHRANNPAIYQERSRKLAQRRRDDLQYRFERPRRAAERAHERRGLPFEDVDLAALCNRDNWSCGICCGPVDRDVMDFQHPRGMSFDHVIPESAGGGWTWANLQLTHRGCNVMRGNRPLEEAREFAREFMRRLAS
jgi:5-methylcytosine-specific restriction endonuclease McrA